VARNGNAPGLGPSGRGEQAETSPRIAHDSAPGVLFGAERAEYLASVDRETKEELLAGEVEELQRLLCRSLAGRQHARTLGLPTALAPVVGVLLYSLSREARLRAAGLIVRSAGRAVRRAA
jgi:hypothetical protein